VDGCPFTGNLAAFTAHRHYCEGLHSQLTVIDNQADTEQSNAQDYLVQIKQLELKVTQLEAVLAAQGRVLSPDQGRVPSAAGHSQGPVSGEDEGGKLISRTVL
jgi:hypothetical protein